MSSRTERCGPSPSSSRTVPIYTSAGITAGIDLALALVEEDRGHAAALKIARFLVMYLVRPGDQAQFSHMLAHQAVTSKPLRELQIWMMENLREDLTVEKLADRLGMSARHFTRVCLKEAQMNPGQFVDRMRVEAARQMIDSSNLGRREDTSRDGSPNGGRFSRFRRLLASRQKRALRRQWISHRRRDAPNLPASLRSALRQTATIYIDLREMRELRSVTFSAEWIPSGEKTSWFTRLIPVLKPGRFRELNISNRSQASRPGVSVRRLDSCAPKSGTFYVSKSSLID